MSVDDLARLVAIENIKQLKARYYRVFWPEGHPNKSLHGFGHEHETYEMIDGKWRIKSTKLVRLKTDIERNTPGE
jgi:hypothetical protein